MDVVQVFYHAAAGAARAANVSTQVSTVAVHSRAAIEDSFCA